MLAVLFRLFSGIGLEGKAIFHDWRKRGEVRNTGDLNVVP
jgi:hypothetical protein